MENNTTDLQQVYHATLTRLQGIRDQMAAQGLIVKDEPFTPLYMHATRDLMEARDRQALHVIICIANHADEMGWCYPSTQTIGQQTGYSTTTVEAAMSRLMAKDWLRVSMVYNRRRKRYEKDFVLSPAVLYIRPEIRNEAWQRFVDTKHFKSWEDLKLSVTQNIKPYTEPASATRYINQNQEPESEPSSSSSRKGGSAKNQNGAERDDPNSAVAPTGIDNDQSEKQNAHSEAHSDSNNAVIPTGQGQSPPVPAHPPLPPDFDPKQPLPDAQDEAAAKRLHGMFKTLQLRRARMYIARYDRETVLTAATIAHDSPHVRNPVGKMDSDLRKSLTDPQDEIPEKRKYLSGESAAWVEH